jgi:nucleotide-binding universal stress UspA family protein
MEIKSILFPTDFSEGSVQALPYAVEFAKKYSAKLYILHVIYDMAKGSGLYVPHVSMDQLYREIQDGAKKELDNFGVEALSGMKNVERMVITGVPHHEIVEFANKNKIDIVVIGTHGRTGIDRLLFGSTAAQVVRNAPCPVLTVRVPKY